jgi:beta-glucanase (GH16 family)
VKVQLIGAATVMATALGAVAAISHGDVAAAASSGYKLKWSDEFNGKSLSSSWQVLPTSAGAGRTCAVASKKMATVSAGKAKISATVNKANTAKCVTAEAGTFNTRYLNSQIRTTKSFLYGKFEARIKFQGNQGSHAAFWMLPSTAAPAAGTSPTNLPGYRGVEVDVAEYFGDGFTKKGMPKGGLYSYVYWPKAGGPAVKTQGNTVKATKAIGSKKASGGYHTYAVEWTPTAYIFSVDGKQTAKITVGVSHRPENLLLSMLTSDWELSKLSKKNLPSSMSVDWIHVYQK